MRARQEISQERIFDELLMSLDAVDPVESMLKKVVRLCGGSALVINELGEVVRSVGAAPSHLVSEWIRSSVFSGGIGSGSHLETIRGTIGRWDVSARTMRIRLRDHAVVVASQDDEEAVGDRRAEVDAVLDTVSKLLRAFAGFESFSISNRNEESARLLRDLEVGISVGREASLWRSLERFGFSAFEPVRVLRIRTDPEQTSTELRRAEVGNGLLLSDSGTMPTEIEMIALCKTDYEIRQRFDEPGLIGIGISGPFTALSQVPEMLRAADVALVAAADGGFAYVDELRPIEWAAARMNSRFDRQLISRFLGLLSESEDAWTTLTTYIDCGAKISETAARLHVHENTVRYRLGQIEKKLNRRLSDPFTMADIVIAFESKRMEIAR
ncbi:PucR family transcriptional regulator [Brevibacterium linens]|uniref:PucR C-terminal helix-turn-helix domain-containing protein n=1 Tax=Brevibacterium linens TaxID=1703 RepID=A0A2H1K9X0_BRELN|nr:helix-turn-helix domain-containing protein [Brevibacterium linens]SMX96607.1 PucR C-terminal helix-turn-helix domain-containing protein [Brevibacterium linens]